MEWNWKFCGDGWGRDGSETGWGWVGLELKSVGMGLISVPMQVSSTVYDFKHGDLFLIMVSIDYNDLQFNNGWTMAHV